MPELILLAEPDSSVAMAIREALHEAGFETKWCSSAASLGQLSADLPFKAAIIDVLKDHSGVEIARVLRLQRPSLPIVFTTALPLDSTRETAGEMQIEIVYKPFKARDLASLIKLLGGV